MKNKKIITLVHHITLFIQGGSVERRITAPMRDWIIILLFWLSVTGGIVGWGAYVYIVYKQEGFSISFEAPVTTQLYRPELVDAALATMAKRERQREELLAQNRETTLTSFSEIASDTAVSEVMESVSDGNGDVLLQLENTTETSESELSDGDGISPQLLD